MMQIKTYMDEMKKPQKKMNIKKLNKNTQVLKNVKHMHLHQAKKYRQMKMNIAMQNEMNEMNMKIEQNEQHIIITIAFAYRMDFMDLTRTG